ncbi:MAG: 3-phenylpropionate/cinnamic acid dioxygenase subunit beta [Hyphomonadaceae bacterium]|nr:3-phenylpropionate/cinnamic acid dioxygenase subunit beta [Hyphomonadaceae bacterium]
MTKEPTKPRHAPAKLASARLELQHEIEQFLYAEAELLDWRRFEEWYDHLADDLHYYMPVRFNRTAREMDHEFARANEAAHFDDDRQSMLVRIKRLRTNMAWAEEPASRTRHLITNVRIKPAQDDELEVRSCFMLYRNRAERDVDIFVGERHDVLRRSDKPLGWCVGKRTIYLDQATILAKNISIFF